MQFYFLFDLLLDIYILMPFSIFKTILHLCVFLCFLSQCILEYFPNSLLHSVRIECRFCEMKCNVLQHARILLTTRKF